MAMPNLEDDDVTSACMSTVAFMKAPDELGINKDFPEKLLDGFLLLQLAKGAPMNDSEIL